MKKALSLVTTKGQVVIPAIIRKKYGIVAGTLICFNDKNGKINMVPLTPRAIDKNIGFLQTKGKLTKALLAEKKREKKR